MVLRHHFEGLPSACGSEANGGGPQSEANTHAQSQPPGASSLCSATYRLAACSILGSKSARGVRWGVVGVVVLVH